MQILYANMFLSWYVYESICLLLIPTLYLFGGDPNEKPSAPSLTEEYLQWEWSKQ